MSKNNKTESILQNLFSSLIKVYRSTGGLVGLILFVAAIAVIYTGYTFYNTIEPTVVPELSTTITVDQLMKLPREELMKLIWIDLEGFYNFPQTSTTLPVDQLMTLPVDQLMTLPKEELLKLIWIDLEGFYNLYLKLDTADSELVRRSSYLDHTFTKLMIPTSEDILVNVLLHLVEIFDRVQTSGVTEEDILFMRERGKVIEHLMLHHNPSLKGEYLSRDLEFEALLSPELIHSDAREAAIREAVIEVHAEINATYREEKEDLLQFEDLFYQPGMPEFNKTFSLSESNPLEASKKIMEERYGKNWEDPKNKDCRLYSNRGNNSGEWFPWVVVGAGVITVLCSLVSLFGGGACCSTTSC